jgi:hypothetical protein
MGMQDLLVPVLRCEEPWLLLRLLVSLQEFVSLEVQHLLRLPLRLGRNDDAKLLLSLLLEPFHLLLTCASPC